MSIMLSLKHEMVRKFIAGRKRMEKAYAVGLIRKIRSHNQKPSDRHVSL